MERRNCFGVLENVFPLGKEGLREVPPECKGCEQRVPCMKAALASEDGIRLQEERIESSERSGMIGRLERWSRRKQLSRLKGKAGKE